MKFTFVADSKPLISAEHLLVLVPAAAFGPRSPSNSAKKRASACSAAAPRRAQPPKDNA
jgi:hypothetical protein